MGNGSHDCAGVGLCSSAAWCVVWDDGAQILGDSDCQLGENPFFQDRLECDTWAHAVELPIRLPILQLTYGYQLSTLLST